MDGFGCRECLYDTSLEAGCYLDVPRGAGEHPVLVIYPIAEVAALAFSPDTLAVFHAWSRPVVLD